MKKTLLAVLACAAVFTFVGCDMIPGAGKNSVVDFRNRDAKGKVVSREADNARKTVEFSYELLPEIEGFNGNAGTTYSTICKTVDGELKYYTKDNDEADFQKMVDAISFEDCADGIKFVFKKPADYGNLTWLVFQYVDKNGNRSTNIDRDDWTELFAKGDIEVKYPLVIAGEEAKFWIMFSSANPAEPSVNFFYKVMPAHGEACPKVLPKDYDETKLISIDGTTIKYSDFIPPNPANGKLQRGILVHEQNIAGRAWEGEGVDVVDLGAFYAAATEDEVAAGQDGEVVDFSLDLKTLNIDKSLSKGYGYMFVEVIYTYTMADYPGYFFATPAIKPMCVENKLF